MDSTALELIMKRRTAITVERARLKQERQRIDADEAKLAAEESELAVAQRVFSRLSEAKPDAVDDTPDLADRIRATLDMGEDISIPKNGSDRPRGIPTVPEMLDIILADAERAGKEGLVGRDLVVQIDKRWWRGVGWNDILPTAARLAKKNRLGRNGSLYTRAVAPAAASPNGSAGTTP